jgi:hypothetical protein
LVAPREVRLELAAAPPAQSGEDDTEAETLCQNSDVAIFDLQTSKAQGESWNFMFQN